MMKRINLNMHTDAGHGWLACKRDLVLALGLAGSISRYSYQKGGTVYLEEDCDMPLVLRALADRGVLVNFKEKYRDHSPIRTYAHFQA